MWLHFHPTPHTVQSCWPQTRHWSELSECCPGVSCYDNTMHQQGAIHSPVSTWKPLDYRCVQRQLQQSAHIVYTWRKRRRQASVNTGSFPQQTCTKANTTSGTKIRFHCHFSTRQYKILRHVHAPVSDSVSRDRIWCSPKEAVSKLGPSTWYYRTPVNMFTG